MISSQLKPICMLANRQSYLQFESQDLFSWMEADVVTFCDVVAILWPVSWDTIQRSWLLGPTIIAYETG